MVGRSPIPMVFRLAVGLLVLKWIVGAHHRGNGGMCLGHAHSHWHGHHPHSHLGEGPGREVDSPRRDV